jgi:hypothetical protein
MCTLFVRKISMDYSLGVHFLQLLGKKKKEVKDRNARISIAKKSNAGLCPH